MRPISGRPRPNVGHVRRTRCPALRTQLTDRFSASRCPSVRASPRASRLRLQMSLGPGIPRCPALRTQLTDRFSASRCPSVRASGHPPGHNSPTVSPPPDVPRSGHPASGTADTTHRPILRLQMSLGPGIRGGHNSPTDSPPPDVPRSGHPSVRASPPGIPGIPVRSPRRLNQPSASGSACACRDGCRHPTRPG